MQNDFTSMKTNLKSVATVLSELQTTVNQISNSMVTVEQKFMQLDADVEDINHHLNKHDDELHELHNKAQENEELRDRIKNIEETLQQLRAHPPHQPHQPPQHSTTTQSSPSTRTAHQVWIGGYGRRVATPTFRTTLEHLKLHYIPTELHNDIDTMMINMRPGFSIQFKTHKGMNDFIQAMRAHPPPWTDPTTNEVMKLYAARSKSPAERHQISLMTAIYPIALAHVKKQSWWNDNAYQLRSTGTSGTLWVENIMTSEAYEMLTVDFRKTPTTYTWEEKFARYYGVNDEINDEINRAMQKWASSPQ